MKTITVFICIIVAATSSRGQVQFQGGLSLLRGTGYYNNHSQLVGGTFSAKYMIREQFFIGATMRNYHSAVTPYPDYFTQDHEKNYAVTLDVLFRKNKSVQPYIGLDYGVSQTSHRVAYTRVKHSFRVGSIKAGLQGSVVKSKATGIFAQVQYNHTGSVGQPSHIDGINNPILTEPISNYVTLDVGVFIRLYAKLSLLRIGKQQPPL